MVRTPDVVGRRNLAFATLDDFLDDAHTLAGAEYRTLGNWNYGQILGHLANSMHWSLDGFPFRFPWLMRTFVGPLVKNSALIRPLKPGTRLPRNAVSSLPEETLTVEDTLADCQRAVQRLAVEIPAASHPMFGKMASEEWMALHIRHAELHMSFVIPAA